MVQPLIHLSTIGWQNERYLARQLKMFQSGERDAALMTAQLVGKRARSRQTSSHYASLPAKAAEASGSDNIELAQRIYKGGIAEGVAACSSCHGPAGGGNAQADSHA